MELSDLALAPIVVLSLTAACAGDSSTDAADETGGEDAGPVVVEVVLGARHSCARLDSGSVQCWGGQLGLGEIGEPQPGPGLVDGLDGPAVAVSNSAGPAISGPTQLSHAAAAAARAGPRAASPRRPRPGA